jgi:hypothetical protein
MRRNNAKGLPARSARTFFTAETAENAEKGKRK